MRQLLVSVAIAATLGACTWVPMEKGAAQVRVARADESLVACEKRGEVSVSVKDKVGFYERNDIKVRDELETLARNEAGSLSADTVQPRGEPAAGEQRFAAFRCGGAAAARPAQPAAASPAGDAETYPIED